MTQIKQPNNSKLYLLLYIATTLVVVVFCSLSIAFFYLRHNATGIVQEYADKILFDTDFAIHFQNVAVVFWPTPMLIAGHVALENSHGICRIDEIKLYPDPVSMLRGSFVLHAIELKAPVLQVNNSPDLLKTVGEFFPFGSGTSSAVDPENLKLTITDGSVSIKEDGQFFPTLSSLNIAVDTFSLSEREREYAIKIGGNVYKGGVPLSFFIGGKTLLDFKLTYYRATMKDVTLRLENDSAAFDAEALYPIPKDDFNLKGSLRIQRVSLTRWLGFGRLLTPGLQWALDDVTGGILHFTMDGKGLDVPSIAACAAGSCFTGSGSVKSWAEPVVALDLETSELNLAAPLPEATGHMPSPPVFGNSPLTPVPNTPFAPGDINVSYDIRLGAKILNYGPLLMEKVKVIIHEGKLGENGLTDTLISSTADLYGGSLQAHAILGGGEQRPYAISGYFRDIKGDELAEALDVVPVHSGRMKGNVDIKSQGRALAEFLDKLTGKMEVDIVQGALRALPSKRNAGKTSAKNAGHSKFVNFDNLALKIDVNSAVFEDEKKRLGLNGQWSSVLNGSNYKLRANIAGMLYFGVDSALSFQNRPGTFLLQFFEDKGKNVPLELKGNFSCVSEKGHISVSNGRLSTSGLEANGDVQLFEDGESVAYKGAISLNSKDAAQLAASVGIGNAALLSGVGPITLAADIKGNNQMISLENLKAVIDDIPLRGSLSAALGNPPSFEFKLAIEEFSINRFFKEDSAKSEHTEKPWDLRALRDVQAKGLLRIGSLKFSHFLLQDANIPMVLANGRLTMEVSATRLYGGNLAGKAALEFSRGLRFENHFSVKGVDMAVLSPSISAGILLGGKMDFTLDMSGNLTGVETMAKMINGSWNFVARNGSYQKIDKESGEPQGKMTIFDTAEADGSIKAGVATSENFVLRGKDIVMTGGGLADFNSYTLDCDVVINMKNLPNIPVRLHGNFKDSKTTVSIGKVILNTLSGIPKGIFEILGDIMQGAWNLLK